MLDHSFSVGLDYKLIRIEDITSHEQLVIDVSLTEIYCTPHKRIQQDPNYDIMYSQKYAKA